MTGLPVVISVVGAALVEGKFVGDFDGLPVGEPDGLVVGAPLGVSTMPHSVM